ncbi:general transcription factor 3C polypeptide 1 [Halichoeres trimaculatus]|uniref:general transcription factor 3C polypeptide 1 n=1 Tax=Halichoeres trimaculatus TaxID=147232 RepID=UPI003D9FA359
MDALSAVVDEVALEGLDGITIPSLWIRLQARQPKFPLQLDDCTKEFLWKSLSSNSDLTFFELPQEREDVELFDRFKEVDPETGIERTEMFSDTQKNSYPVQIILDDKNGIQGSCAVFKERKDITKLIRSKSFTPTLTLQEAVERYGRKLVVVASQVLRFRTLIGSESDPDLKLTDDSYCVLERIGRSRWQGELQRDLHRCSFKIDARKAHYLRKSLVRNGLITVQSYVTRAKSGQQQHSVLLLLSRFHVNRRNKYDLLMEYVSNLLQQMPGQFTTVMSLRQQLNVNDRTFKRMFQYMRSAKLAEYCMYPLEDLDPGAGPCINKKGKKVLVRCVKLLKPFSKRNVADDDDDEDEDDEDESGGRRAAHVVGRIMEMDILSQAYQCVLSSGANGIPKSTIAFKMNIGKLESRMIVRTLERAGMIKGFMVDEGRQRTTKYISHRSVDVSDQIQRFAEEQERNKLLSSSTSPTPAAASSSKSRAEAKSKAPAKRKTQRAGRGRKGDAKDNGVAENATEEATGKNDAMPKETQPAVQPATAESETPNFSKPPTPASSSRAESGEVEREEEEGGSSLSPTSSLPQTETLNADDNPEESNSEVIKELKTPRDDTFKRSKRSPEGGHETYRLLRRKNLIVEAVRDAKVIEGTFPLQKMINEDERQNCRTRCCKKTILRLTQSLSRQGLIKILKTTVVQDGITKNVEMFVHPSVQPSDDVVKRVIEQVRFKISSSCAAVRQQQVEEKAKQEKDRQKCEDKDFKPTTVRGLGRSLGFQPKMHRFRVIHNFLWYLIYGHPQRHDAPDSPPNVQTPANTSEKSADPQTADSSASKLDAMSSGDEEEEEQDKSAPCASQKSMTAYADEDSWRRFVPPLRVHKEYGPGWAMVSDVLLCLPLSVFIQVMQINYKVDGLEEYLNDPVKQHYLVSMLPAKMRRQLLYRRKYIFCFHENLQRLVYMGLVQFGPVEKFKEKDMMYLYVKRNATIVDTTSSEPHYWLVSECPDKPFEKRRYTFNSAEDVENYWFDLMCVCLNTPLGVIRSRRCEPVDVTAPSFVHDRYVFTGLAYLLKGSIEVCDDGSTPGDGKGAGGLDSQFFGHLKRNWLWTNHLLAVKTTRSGTEAKQTKVRLRSLLNRNALRIALTTEGTAPGGLTNKRSVMVENVKIGIEPATRNKMVVGGKGQKRKRSKKEIVKPPPKKKKEPKKRTPAHDEADHKALKMMTRQRVLWTIQEDSLMMLCSVATHLLNSKLKRPFIPHCVVRDLLHTEFEISADKTSIAVGRRTRYILKNPQTLLNYRICLAEVYEDKPLMQLLEEKKPVDPNSPEDCATAFSEYVRLLREKFSSVVNAELQEALIPNTKHELFSRFRVSAIETRKQVSCKDTLTCTDDIHTIVLHNLIQSTLAMNNIQMKSSRSFQTFHMYSKYNQELLCQVFIQCRKKGLVNRRRISQLFGPKKSRGLPILPMSYQLSNSYYRSFSWRFPNTLCTDAFRFLRSLINNGMGDDKPLTAFYHETENRSVHGELITEQRSAPEKKKKTSTGMAASKLVSEPEAQSNNSAAEEGENHEGKLEGEEKTGEAEEQKNPEESSKVCTGDDQPSREQREDHLPESVSSDSSREAPEESPNVSDMLRFSLDSPGGACLVTLSLMSLGLLSIHLSIPKRMVVVDSNMVDNDAVKNMAALEEEEDEDEDGEECEGRKKMQVKAHQASHTNYLMLRGYCTPGIVKLRNLNTSDNIVLESCNVRLQLRNTPAHHAFSKEITDFPPSDLLKCGPSLLPSSLTYSTSCPFSSSPSDVTECEKRLVVEKGFTPQDIEACAQIRKSLDEAGENGVDIHDLLQTHRHLEEPQSGHTRGLQQYLKGLQAEGQVVKVGSSGVRWVLMRHAEPWLLTLNWKQWSQSSSSSDKLTFLQRQHNFPFMRKRCRRGTRREKEEPPSKKPAVDRQESEHREDVDAVCTDVTRDEATGEEQHELQKDNPDEGVEEKVLNTENEEGGEKTLPEETEAKEAGQENVENEERRGQRRERRARKGSISEDTCAQPTGAADDHDEEENVSFISRPWRMVDGSLNRPVCKGMLEGLLYHIMNRPGLTQRSLVEHYKALLQPLALLDLVEALITMGCVKRKTLVKAPKTSLFARSVPQTGSEAQVIIEDPDCIFYEPTIDCSLRLSRVLPNERNWNMYESN